MYLLLDTNVVLDVLLNRTPWVTDSRAVWDACDKSKLQGLSLLLRLPTFSILRVVKPM